MLLRAPSAIETCKRDLDHNGQTPLLPLSHLYSRASLVPLTPHDIFHESLTAYSAQHRDVDVAATGSAAALFTKATATHPGQISLANREKRNTSTDRYETTARNINAMVEKASAGRGGIGRVRAPGVRIQPGVSSIQLNRCGHL